MIPLPTFTFIFGPSGSGKTELQRQLCSQDSALAPISFAEPLRAALLATYYPDEVFRPSGLDLRQAEAKTRHIPGVGKSNKDFLIQYGRFLRQFAGPHCLGQPALNTATSLIRSYNATRVVFDDARMFGDVQPFLSTHQNNDSLLLVLSRTGASWQSGDNMEDLLQLPIRKVALTNNGAPADMLKQLDRLLGGGKHPPTVLEGFNLPPTPPAREPGLQEL